MNEEVLVRVENVSKKFCRKLKTSLWYGVKDSVTDLFGGMGSSCLRTSEFWALDDVSFEVKQGEALGLIGRNGAGKTTLLKMLNGLIKPDKGSIEVRGRIGALIALGAGFSPILTGRENIYVNGAVLGLTKKEIDKKFDEIIDFAEIDDFVDTPVRNYSSGMTVRLGFAVAAAIRPDILILDEVLAVGDVGFQAKCFNTLADFRKKGTVFILVSHNMHIISRYCDSVIFMREGRVRYEGAPQLAIAEYNSLFEARIDATERNDFSSVTSSGSGRIQIINAHFEDCSGKKINSINAGEGLTIVIEYKKHHGDAINPVVDLVIRDGSREVFQGTNQSDKHEACEMPDEGRLRVDFASIPLNVNRLECFVAILDADTKELFDWRRGLRLMVEPTSALMGSLLLKPKWSVTPSKKLQ